MASDLLPYGAGSFLPCAVLLMALLMPTGRRPARHRKQLNLHGLRESAVTPVQFECSEADRCVQDLDIGAVRLLRARHLVRLPIPDNAEPCPNWHFAPSQSPSAAGGVLPPGRFLQVVSPKCSMAKTSKLLVID